ncbi:MAG: response regulator, partial [Desulfobacula sp.]|nr:response regulator [Desulfobacula sp.]
MKTLIVDDDFVSRTKMHTIMESFGECEAVENGPDAIESFKEALAKGMLFDLITLDIAMPDMDGTEVLFNIRKIETEKNIPKQKQVKILMVTSHSDKDNYITCLQAGCNDYIVKPFDLESISKKLEEIQSKEQFDFTGKEAAQLSPEMTERYTSKDGDSHFKNYDATKPHAQTDNMKTLIVDDDFVSRTKMHTIMESFGECEAVENGPDAIESFKEALAKGMPFDLITLDIAMPDMDGTEVLFNIREIEIEKNIPKQKQVKILMVTSHSDKDNYITCVQAG